MNTLSLLLLLVGLAVLLIGFLIRRVASKQGELRIVLLTRPILLIGVIVLGLAIITS